MLFKRGLGSRTAGWICKQCKTTGARSAHGDGKGAFKGGQQAKRRLNRWSLRLHNLLQIVLQRWRLRRTDRLGPGHVSQDLSALLEGVLSREVAITLQLPAAAIGPGSRHTHAWILHQQHRQGFLHSRQRLQQLAATETELTAPRHTEGHVGTEFSRKPLQV